MIHLSSTSPVPTPVTLGERLEQFAKRLNLLASIRATQNYFSLWASFSLLGAISAVGLYLLAEVLRSEGLKGWRVLRALFLGKVHTFFERL
jgi:hypothetical protein